MSPVERAVASRQLTNRLFRTHEFTSAESIACFLPMEEEVDTHPVFARAWRAKKRIFAPVIDGKGEMVFRRLGPETPLCRNSFGIWEPASQEIIDPRRLDLVLTPLAAFDKNKHRIGMGGGYFDRCFAFLKPRRHWRRPKLFGLAFDAQEVEEIVPNPWDIRLYGIATQSRISRL
jgi:5-formyltetrahydrofolate cyclo-ligase